MLKGLWPMVLFEVTIRENIIINNLHNEAECTIRKPVDSRKCSKLKGRAAIQRDIKGLDTGLTATWIDSAKIHAKSCTWNGITHANNWLESDSLVYELRNECQIHYWGALERNQQIKGSNSSLFDTWDEVQSILCSFGIPNRRKIQRNWSNPLLSENSVNPCTSAGLEFCRKGHEDLVDSTLIMNHQYPPSGKEGQQCLGLH